MTIDINSLPIATPADLQRVGQYLRHVMGNVYRIQASGSRRALLLAASRGGYVGGEVTIGNLYYQVLTEAQAIELARAMPHVDEAWKATWVKAPLPTFGYLRSGDKFDMGKVEFAVHVGTYATYLTQPGDAYQHSVMEATWEFWRSHEQITNFRRAEPATNIGELVAKKMAEVAPEPYIRVDDSYVAKQMEAVNAEYAERQELEKDQIKREWFKVHSAGTNGLCVMRGRR